MSQLHPVDVPVAASLSRYDCTAHQLSGMSGEARPARLLVSQPEPMFDGVPPLRNFYIYFQPDEEQLQALENGGFIELRLIGLEPPPFQATVWGAPTAAPPTVIGEVVDGT